MPPSRNRRLPLLLALLSPSWGCHSWHVQGTPAELLAQPALPAEIRLRLLDSSQVVIRDPRLTRDSVAGTRKSARIAVPVDSVAEVAVRRFSPGRTVGLVGASVATLFVVAAAVCASDACAPSFGPPDTGD